MNVIRSTILTPDGQPSRPGRHRAFTLLESLVAVGILLIAVIAVSSAVTAGQQHAFEAKLRIAGACAAEELMGRLNAVSFSDLIQDWDGFEEEPGQMQTAQGDNYPEAFDLIGRRVTISSSTNILPGVNVNIQGLIVNVEAFDHRDETLVVLRRFVPQSQFVTVPGVDEDDDLASGSFVRTQLDDFASGIWSGLDQLFDDLGLGGLPLF